ncbi:hypothetical protein [Paenibacillus silagei]|uniref:Lipoprotein n=1 Tax=Paenibacillus silagei TaxID=1670801 RepID=A0ABS4NIJ2_9BACL|nr:hypothetical protein [Paenibacillus silagei]MBP2109864.1 hypothetical protein [Paenibacillus silagei]
MIRLQGRMLLLSGAVTGMLLLQACGQNTAANGNGESFAAVVEAPQSTAEVTAEAESSASPSPQATAPTAKDGVAASAAPSKGTDTGTKVTVTFKPSPSPTAAPVGTATRKPSGKNVTITPSPAASSSVQSPRPAAASKGTGESSAEAEPVKAGSAPALSVSPSPSPSAAAEAASTVSAASTGNKAIDWNGFFDGDDQTRPSEHFWDLSGQQVTIKGFMGEVLSFEKNWFLLIPEPGAECPFDNGDETYWNKIMIVFVPEGSKLRYTSGPLEISGRLDVGIKIDESGYKTMFRLYDASFKSL